MKNPPTLSWASLRPPAFLIMALALSGCVKAQSDDLTIKIAPEDIRSGFEFLSSETRSAQNDPFANPGYLWVETGSELFSLEEDGPACATCHTDPELGFQDLSYPAIDKDTGDLINIEDRINLCRTQHQKNSPLDYESEPLLSLTAFVKAQANGRVHKYDLSEALRSHALKGQEYFFTRRGQLNLSCHQCHDQNWGKKMRGDTVSQGHINGFPAYRNDWQTLGSAHRRFNDCDLGVRAEPQPLGSLVYKQLETYLMVRGQGLVSETPAMRR